MAIRRKPFPVPRTNPPVQQLLPFNPLPVRTRPRTLLGAFHAVSLQPFRGPVPELE